MKIMKNHPIFLLAVPFLLLGVAASAIASDTPRVPRTTLAAAEKSLDTRFAGLWSDNPFIMLGPTRGIYLEGYGTVFTAEVNLVAGPQIGILTPSMTKQSIAEHRQKKIARLPELKKAMAKALADTAASPEMAAVPPDEQIVLVAFLSHFPWEDISGLPTQIMMQGSKKKLMEAQRERRRRSRSFYSSRAVLTPMRLGEILIHKHLITSEDLDRALELQRERGDKLGKILVDLGFIAARDVLIALSEQLQVPLLVIEGPPAVSPETETLSPKFLRQFRCLPMRLHDHTVTLAMADPLDFETRSTVAACTGLAVLPGLAGEQEILDAIDRYYGQNRKNETEMALPVGEANEDLEHLRDMASEAPVIRLVNAMVAQAVEKARQRYSHRAVRKRIPHSLPH